MIYSAPNTGLDIGDGPMHILKLSGHRFLNSTGPVPVGQWFQSPTDHHRRFRNPTLHRKWNDLNNISLFINVHFVTFYLYIITQICLTCCRAYTKSTTSTHSASHIF